MISQDIAKLREMFLFNVDFQAKLKATQTNEDFLTEAIAFGKKHGLNISMSDLENALEEYARTGEGGSPTCGVATDNQPPLDEPTADNLINLVRNTENGICKW